MSCWHGAACRMYARKSQTGTSGSTSQLVPWSQKNPSLGDPGGWTSRLQKYLVNFTRLMNLSEREPPNFLECCLLRNLGVSLYMSSACVSKVFPASSEQMVEMSDSCVPLQCERKTSVPFLGKKRNNHFYWCMYACMLRWLCDTQIRSRGHLRHFCFSLATLLFLTCDTFETNAPWGVRGGLGWLGLIWSNSVRNNLQQDRTPGRSSAIDFHSRHSGPAPGLVSGVGWGGCNNVPDSLRTV